MSIVKDLLFLLPIIILVFYYYFSKKNIENNNAFFLNTIKHDLKVPLLAQINALNLLNSDSEIINELKSSSKELLNMLNMLIYLYEKDLHSKENFNLSEILIESFKSLNGYADSRNIDFYYSMNKNIALHSNKKALKAVMCSLISILISESKCSGNLICSAEDKPLSTKISISCPIRKHPKQKDFSNNLLKSVGYNINSVLCKKLIKEHGWILKEFVDKYNMKSFTIVIYQPKRIFGLILAILQLFRHNKLKAGKSVLATIYIFTKFNTRNPQKKC